MKTNAEKQQKPSARLVSGNGQDFNFELWARQVRPLLLASLNKRGK